MLNGFENITYDLTDYELNVLLPVFVQGFKKKVGIINKITNKEIVQTLQKKGYKVDGPRARKIINHIRTRDLIPGLVATSQGYYITSDPMEIKKYIDSLDGRENEIRRVKQSMKNYLNKLITGAQSQLNF